MKIVANRALRRLAPTPLTCRSNNILRFNRNARKVMKAKFKVDAVCRCQHAQYHLVAKPMCCNLDMIEKSFNKLDYFPEARWLSRGFVSDLHATGARNR